MQEQMLHRLALATVVLCAALTFLPGLGRVALFDRDEPRFAEAARQMIVRGDYVVPYYNGAPRLHKPVLIYWVMVAGYRLFGVGEFGARVGSALAGIGTAALVYLLARRMFNWRVGLLAGLITATNLQEIVIARAATADSLQLLTLLLTFTGFWLVHEGDRRFRSYLFLYGGLALSALAKGPVVFLIFLLVLIAVMLIERRAQFLRDLRLAPGILAALAAVALWLVPAEIATRGGFIMQGLGHHIIRRSFTESFESHSGPAYFYIALLPVAFFPWFGLLPISLKWFLAAAEARRHKTFLVVWAVAPYLLFSFLKTKLPHYVLPAYPALAIIIAFALDRAIAEGRSLCGHWLGAAGMVIFALTGIALAGALAAFPSYTSLAGTVRFFAGAALLALVMTVLAVADAVRRRNNLVPLHIALGTSLLVFVLWTGGLPAMDIRSAPKTLGQEVRRLTAEGDKVLAIGHREDTLVFYGGRRVHFVGTWEQVAALLAEPNVTLCVAREDKLRPPKGDPLDQFPVGTVRLERTDLGSRGGTAESEVLAVIRRDPDGERCVGLLREAGRVEGFLPSHGRTRRWVLLARVSDRSGPAAR